MKRPPNPADTFLPVPRCAVKALSLVLLTLSMAIAVSAQNIAELKEQAASGDAKSQYNLGWLYYKGQGVPQDYAQAGAWFRKAADQGDVHAQNSLGWFYFTGWATKMDEAQAAMWFRKAAEQGDAQSQYDLGVAYDRGWGVPRDHVQAAYWYRKAADQGVAAARGNLSEMQSEDGIGSSGLRSKLRSYWPTTIRVDTDMDTFWLPDEERTCQTHPNYRGKVAVVACNASGSHHEHNIPVKFWGDPERNMVSDWKCRREGDNFVCRAID